MNRFRFLLVALCTLAFAGAASATSPIDTPSAGGFCNKLCVYGYHCVPTPKGGVCVPGNGVAELAPTDTTASIDSTDSAGLLAGGSFCNKLCVYGYRCVPTPNGGVCVPGNGVVEPAPTTSTDSAETAEVIGDHCVANANDGELMASNAPPQCGACTILCPYGTHLVRKHNCACVCVGNAG